MKLTFDQICSATVGAAKIYEEKGDIIFRRFTDKESDYYRIYRDEVYMRKTYTTAGVRLAFVTDSKKLSFDYKLEHLPHRPFGGFDVTVNGVLTSHAGIEKGSGEGHMETELGEGEKCVEIYFSWSKGMSLSEVSLDDGATFEPHKRKYTMINYGDSITHGYDSLHPSLSYASQLGQLLCADAVNKAIGGDRFFPELLEVDNGIENPDIVTVAYGTNDWKHHTRATVEKRSRDFYTSLSKKYPSAKIFAITPICRVNSGAVDAEKFGEPLSVVDGILRNSAKGLKNITVINGMMLTPRLPEFYTDGLHPNDLGMCVYARELAREIGKYL